MASKGPTEKREARRERAALEQRDRALRQRHRAFRSRMLFAAGVIVAITIVALAMMRNEGGNQGRVWSAEHGHWHDR
jgi:hypothetical protein